MSATRGGTATPSKEDMIRSANPFEYQSPIRKEELFFDRRVELKEALLVCEKIAKGSTGGVSVYGGRGVGKTSFLNALRRSLAKIGIASTRIPLDDTMVVPGAEPRFFKLILSDLTTAAQEAELLEKSIAAKIKQLLQGVINVDRVEFDALGISLVAEAAQDNKFKDLPYAALRDGLRDFTKLLKRKQGADYLGAMLILDEADLLTQNKALLQIFKNVFQDTPGIGLLLAGTSMLMSEVRDVFSPIPRFFRKIELGPFSDDDEVENAITKTVQLAKNEVLIKGTRLNVVMSGFIRLVTDLTNRLPVEFNMLSHFAYDIGATRVSYENGAANLYMKLDRELLDASMRQWQGIREYVDFLGDLSDFDKTIVTLLSKSSREASIDELTALAILDRMGGASRSAKLQEVVTRLDELGKLRGVVQESIQRINSLEKASKIKVLNSILAVKQLFGIEDQWVRAYFKYSGLGPQVNLEFGFIDENSGALTLPSGDPISSILNTVFLHRVIHHLEAPPPFWINTYPNDGMLLAGRGKILNASYNRAADGRDWHLAFHLKPEMETHGLREDIKMTLENLRGLQLIHRYKVNEKLGSTAWS